MWENDHVGNGDEGKGDAGNGHVEPHLLTQGIDVGLPDANF
jgi:hypothetical protein